MYRSAMLKAAVLVFCLAVGVPVQSARPPRITVFLENDLTNPEQVKAGQENALTLPCEATGSNLKWTWKLNNTEIEPSTNPFFTVTPAGTLKGTKLWLLHSGSYQCFVEDTVSGAKTFSRKLQVRVTDVLDFTDKRGETLTVALGNPLSISCPSHGSSYGAVYKWVNPNRNTVLERNAVRAIQGDGTLYIMFVTEDDVTQIDEMGGIGCEISGANKYFLSGIFTLEVPDNSGPDPKTPRRPSWIKTPELTEYAVQGRNKSLYCLAGGRPAPTIKWRKNGQLISKQNTFRISLSLQDRLLSIVNVDKTTHEDTYTCEAENSQNVGNPEVASTGLIVRVPPRWTSKPPERLDIDIYGNDTLECLVFGDPVPSFSWFKNGVALPPNTQNRVIVNGKTLNFQNVETEDDGVYQCVAESNIGMILSYTWVQVIAKKPSFEETGFGPFYLFKGSQGRLKCEPDAAPRPEFRWFKGSTELFTEGRYTLETDGTLLIDNVVDSDAVQYTCIAKNFLGNDTATASADVLERTKITVAPQNRTVVEGTDVDLRCEATFDPSLELKFLWKKDSAIINYNSKIQWSEGTKVLTIFDVQVYDAGIYTCVAYTPDPKRSEDSASAIVNIQGVPFPPSNLQITDCFERRTNLSWVPGAANDAPITHFIVEQESSYEPFVYRFLKNITNPNVTDVMLNLTAWATLRFRMRAVSALGPSRPSLPTEKDICTTKPGAPDKYPDNFRGVPKAASELDIAWTPLPKVDQNGPGFYYMLMYRRYQPDDELPWQSERISDPSVGVFSVPEPGYYQEWEFQIYAGNNEGEGPSSPRTRSFSGQNPPTDAPTNVVVGDITARSVDLTWNPVTVAIGNVDGYKIYYWGESRVSARRRRRAIPNYAKVFTVLGATAATVTGLTPYSSYRVAIRAFNSGGEGPSSDEVQFPTPEAEPGPPSQVEVFPFGEYILVRWQPPLEPNGVITNYRLGVATYVTAPENVDVDFEVEGPQVFEKLLGDLEFETAYVVKIQAATEPGWGDLVTRTTTTVERSAPAKPERPTVVAIATDAVNVTYNFGLGGGWTHDFKVLYRKKLEGEEFVETPMVDNFEIQWTEIDNLDNDLYQFKTVGKNDVGESIESEITEARPLPRVVDAGQRASTPIHKAAWFIVLLVLIAILLLALLILFLYTRYRGAKYPVGKRERKRAALIDNKPYDEEEGPFERGEDNPPPYPSQGSLDKPDQDSDRDSMDEYGEGPQFKEDGSFVEEYGDDKKAPPDEKDQSAFATFV